MIRLHASHARTRTQTRARMCIICTDGHVYILVPWLGPKARPAARAGPTYCGPGPGLG